jgi:uncharacterized protein YgfB (UPF0149 family)
MTVTFTELSNALEHVEATVPAAEGHGFLCGALCSRRDFSPREWCAEIVPEEHLDTAHFDTALLEDLFDTTVTTLRGAQMEFTPLLPEDDAPLGERLAALTQWCAGFLYGLGTGEAPELIRTSTQVNEVLRDLTDIGQADTRSVAQDEQSETAFAEIVEYVRVGVQLIHDELIQLREAH